MYNDNLRKPNKDRLSGRAMAKALGLPHTTFRREIRRGLLTQPNIRRDREVFEYSAFKAQDSIARGAANKGPPMRMTNLIAQKLKTKIKEYQATKATPEFVIQGIMDDANSDYYAAHGSDVVTCVGCVLTGDLPLTALDAESGSVVDDVINFNIKNII